MVKKQDIYWTCAGNGSLHLIKAKDENDFFSWHLKDCINCKSVREKEHTLQYFIPNSPLASFNYKYTKRDAILTVEQ
jgi:hypothetical protein